MSAALVSTPCARSCTFTGREDRFSSTTKHPAAQAAARQRVFSGCLPHKRRCYQPGFRRTAAARVTVSASTEVSEASTAESLDSVQLQPIHKEGEGLTEIPNTTGVYAVYDAEGKLQYIGLSRKVGVSIANHAESLPKLARSVRFSSVPNPTKENLTAAWKSWIQQAVAQTGEVPPGNAAGPNSAWAVRRARPQPEVKLTPGKGVQDLTCTVEELVKQVVKSNKVVAFVKGTRQAPQCGFSYKVLTLLNEARADYQVVNVLDDVHNPGLRDAIKNYTQWPTIPQVFVKGEFIGGADILEELATSGELAELLKE